MLGCTLWSQDPGETEGNFVSGGIPFIYKVTLVRACSMMACGGQPGTGDRSKLQEQSHLLVHQENAWLGGEGVLVFWAGLYLCFSKDSRNECKSGFLGNLGILHPCASLTQSSFLL